MNTRPEGVQLRLNDWLKVNALETMLSFLVLYSLLNDKVSASSALEFTVKKHTNIISIDDILIRRNFHIIHAKVNKYN